MYHCLVSEEGSYAVKLGGLGRVIGKVVLWQ